MKKLSIIIITLIMTFCIGGTIFADGLEKSGDYFYFKRGGAILTSQFIEDSKNKYYATDNGSLAVNSWIVVDDERYYASNTAALYTNTIETIDGKGYYFDYEGKLRYGWIKGEYYANEDGYLVTGFQRLHLYTSTADFEENPGPSGSVKDAGEEDEIDWFYFNESGTNKYKKFYAEDEEYAVKTINNAKYCFDESGRLCTGWKKIKDKTPIMSGYMYFVEDETENFAFGQALTNTWYATSGPTGDDDITGNSDIRYYYFLSTGSPVCATEGKYIKHRIGEKYYLFNDQAYCEYGIKQVGNDYYYFGDSLTDCSMKTGKYEVDTGDGYKMYYYFDSDGKGYTGVYKDKLYYKGLLQCATEGSKCEAVRINGTTRLVNTNGQILKNKKNYKDSDGNKWSTNSSGVVTYSEDGESRDAEPPEETNQ